MIELTIQVADPDDRLAQYGAGALIRIQSAAASAGPFADIVPAPTTPLLAGVVEYHVYDSGTSATWYRTRFEDALGATPSDWSEPFMGGAYPVYLTLDELKGFGLTSLPDEALLTLLDAARQEIIRYAGPGGTTTELLSSHGDLLMLSKDAASITSIVERDVTLDPTDYEVLSPTLLYRLTTGVNPSSHWGYRVRVTYQQVDDSALRQRVQSELVRLAIAFTPGLASQTIGTWSESYQSNPKPYPEQRADVLAALGSQGMLV